MDHEETFDWLETKVQYEFSVSEVRTSPNSSEFANANDICSDFRGKYYKYWHISHFDPTAIPNCDKFLTKKL